MCNNEESTEINSNNNNKQQSSSITSLNLHLNCINTLHSFMLVCVLQCFDDFPHSCEVNIFPIIFHCMIPMHNNAGDCYKGCCMTCMCLKRGCRYETELALIKEEQLQLQQQQHINGTHSLQRASRNVSMLFIVQL